MRRILILVCLFFPSVAWADIAPPQVPPPPLATGPSGIFRPGSIGAPHVCTDAYPETAREAHIEGTTTLLFHIKIDGSVGDMSIANSSGNTDLDNAAEACALNWKYSPAMKGGVAIEVPWKAQVQWKLKMAEPYPVQTFLEPPRDCLHSHSVSARRLRDIDGTTELLFRITNGDVTDVSVAHSSGNATLDNAAVECVKSWRFKPLVVNGQPGVFGERTRIAWKDALKDQ